MNKRDMLKYLEKHGFDIKNVVRGKGDHIKYYHKENSKVYVVLPMSSKDISLYTIKDCVKKALKAV